MEDIKVEEPWRTTKKKYIYIYATDADKEINVVCKAVPMGRKENPQKRTQLSSRSHPRHLVGNRAAQRDTIIDITSDSQVNNYFPYRWSPASLTFNNHFTYFYIYIKRE